MAYIIYITCIAYLAFALKRTLPAEVIRRFLTYAIYHYVALINWDFRLGITFGGTILSIWR